MTNIGAAFTVRFLRNGDTITVKRDIVKIDGSGAALFQMVDTTSGTVAPNWGVEANQPIIRLTLKSAAGYPVALSSVLWAYNGVNLSFTLNGESWVKENTATYKNIFQARINADGCPELKITGNLASKEAVSNRQISYALTYVTAAHTETIEGSVDVLIQQSGANSHMIQIVTPNIELSGESTDSTYSTTLSVEAYYGINQVTIGSAGYTTKWYKDGTEEKDYINGSEGKSSITVTRADIDGGSIYVCKLLLNGSAVAQDQQRINDISDEYQIEATPSDNSANFASLTNSAIYKLTLKKNGVPQTSGWSFSWRIFNTWGEETNTGSGATVTINPSDCLKKGGTDYADVDVLVTAIQTT